MARPTKQLTLTDDELGSLTTLLRSGETRAQIQTRAHILDLLHRQTHPQTIKATLRVGIVRWAD